MILSDTQIKFLKILITILDNDPDSDMGAYCYYYRDDLQSMLEQGVYSKSSSSYLNELGKYYKKFISNTI